METVLLIVIIFIQILIVILSLFKNNKRNLNQIELVLLNTEKSKCKVYQH